MDNDVSKRLAEVQADAKIADTDKFQQWIKENPGKSYEDFKQELKNNILTQKVVGAGSGQQNQHPATSRLSDYYEKHKSDVHPQGTGLPARDPDRRTKARIRAAIATAEKKAKDVVARARKGERFGELVRDNSDALTAKQGGELPGYAKSDLSPELVVAVWDKPKGQVTEPDPGAGGIPDPAGRRAFQGGPGQSVKRWRTISKNSSTCRCSSLKSASI